MPAGSWVKLQSMARWEEEEEGAQGSALIALKKLCSSSSEVTRTHRRPCRERRQGWNAAKQPNRRQLQAERARSQHTVGPGQGDLGKATGAG